MRRRGARRATSRRARGGRARAAGRSRPRRGARSSSAPDDSSLRAGLASAEAPAPLRVRGERLPELALAEVRPEPVDEDELGVGELPEQEVRDAQLAGGPDD